MSEPSPLAEAMPESLDEFFSKNPMDMTEADITKIISALREQRKRWDLAEAAGKRSAPKSAPKLAAPATISLGDLGL